MRTIIVKYLYLHDDQWEFAATNKIEIETKVFVAFLEQLVLRDLKPKNFLNNDKLLKALEKFIWKKNIDNFFHAVLLTLTLPHNFIM